MSLRSGLRSWLMGQATLTAVIPAARICNQFAEQRLGPAPVIVIRKQSSSPGEDLLEDDGGDEQRFEVHVLGDDFAACDAISDKLKELLHGKHGLTMSGVHVERASLVDDFDTDPQLLQLMADERLFGITHVYELQTGEQ